MNKNILGMILGACTLGAFAWLEYAPKKKAAASPSTPAGKKPQSFAPAQPAPVDDSAAEITKLEKETSELGGKK